MPNYHFQVKTISRGKGRSVTNMVSYISGRNLYDCHEDKTYYKHRQDVLYCRIFLPSCAPLKFFDLQYLCNAIDKSEVRYDARTAREFVGSLPNELTQRELEQIVHTFIRSNFVSHRLCAVAAIHEGRNIEDPSKNNPHVHIIVTTRMVDSNGFSKTKDREQNDRKYINIWRKQWADLQNQAYERNDLDIRVSHLSLEVQGIEREPTIHLNLADYQREKRGEQTLAGNKKRAIKKRNEDRLRVKRERECERTIDRDR